MAAAGPRPGRRAGGPARGHGLAWAMCSGGSWATCVAGQAVPGLQGLPSPVHVAAQLRWARPAAPAVWKGPLAGSGGEVGGEAVPAQGTGVSWQKRQVGSAGLDGAG